MESPGDMIITSMFVVPYDNPVVKFVTVKLAPHLFANACKEQHANSKVNSFFMSGVLDKKHTFIFRTYCLRIRNLPGAPG